MEGRCSEAIDLPRNRQKIKVLCALPQNRMHLADPLAFIIFIMVLFALLIILVVKVITFQNFNLIIATTASYSIRFFITIKAVWALQKVIL